MKTLTIGGGEDGNELQISAIKDIHMGDLPGIISELLVPGLKTLGFSDERVTEGLIAYLGKSIIKCCDECEEEPEHYLCESHYRERVDQVLPPPSIDDEPDESPSIPIPDNPYDNITNGDPLMVQLSGEDDFRERVGKAIKEIRDKRGTPTLKTENDIDDEPFCAECGEITENGEGSLCDGCADSDDFDDFDDSVAPVSPWNTNAPQPPGWNTAEQPTPPVNDMWGTAPVDSWKTEPEQQDIPEPIVAASDPSKPVEEVVILDPTTPDIWICSHCNWENDGEFNESSECEVCSVEKDVTSPPPEAPMMPQPAIPMPWECPYCNWENEGMVVNCEACDDKRSISRTGSEVAPLAPPRPPVVREAQAVEAVEPQVVGMWNTAELSDKDSRSTSPLCPICGNEMKQNASYSGEYWCKVCDYATNCGCWKCIDARKRNSPNPTTTPKYQLTDKQKEDNLKKSLEKKAAIQKVCDEGHYQPRNYRAVYYNCEYIKHKLPSIDCGSCSDCPVGNHEERHAMEHGLFFCPECESYFDEPWPAGMCPECGVHSLALSGSKKEFCNDHWDISGKYDDFLAGEDDN